MTTTKSKVRPSQSKTADSGQNRTGDDHRRGAGFSGPLRIIAAIAVLVAGGVCAVVFSTSTSANTSSMSRLVIHRSGLPGLKSQPESNTFVPSADSTSATVRKYGALDPANTGTYQVVWGAKSKSSTQEAGVVVGILPTPALAHDGLKDVEAHYTGKKFLTSQSLKLVDHFSVPGIPNVYAATFKSTTTTSSTTTPTDVHVVLFQVGRVFVYEVLESTGALTEKNAVTIATAQNRLLSKDEPGFVLATTSRSIATVLEIVAGAVVLAAIILLLPAIWGRVEARRLRKEARAHLREQRHLRSRGSKALRRQRTPAWQQTHRHKSRR